MLGSRDQLKRLNFDCLFKTSKRLHSWTMDHGRSHHTILLSSDEYGQSRATTTPQSEWSSSSSRIRSGKNRQWRADLMPYVSVPSGSQSWPIQVVVFRVHLTQRPLLNSAIPPCPTILVCLPRRISTKMKCFFVFLRTLFFEKATQHCSQVQLFFH